MQQGNARLLGIIQEYFKSGTPPILPDVLAILKQTVQIHKAQLQQIAEEFKDICHTVTALFRNIEQTMEQNGLWNLMPKGVHTVSKLEGLKKLKDHRAIPSFDAAAGLAQLVVEMERLLKSLTPVTICRNAAEAQFIEGLRQMYTVESERMVLMKVMNIPGSRPAGATAITDSTGSGSVEFF